MKSIMTLGLLLLTFFAQARDNHWNYAFIENKGQIIDQNNLPNPKVKYLWNGGGMKLQLRDNAFSYEVLRSEKFPRRKPLPESMMKDKRYQGLRDSLVWHSHRVDVSLVNANPHPVLVAEEAQTEVLNYYTTGTPEEGVTNVHQYGKVIYKNIYPNIDLEFESSNNSAHPFKYNFIVHPGGDVNAIQLRYEGANAVSLTKGSIHISTANGKLEEVIPASFTVENSKSVNVKYQSLANNTYGFKAEQYSVNQTLVIDPWATYFGWDVFSANGGASINSVTTDGQLNIFTIGTTDIPNNIASSGAFQITSGGGDDAFIRKFTPLGFPLWCTYYGGNGVDWGIGIQTDDSGNIIFIITTGGGNNLTTAGTFMPALPSFFINASIIGKLNNNGIRQWATYYLARLGCIRLDHSGNIVAYGVGTDTGLATINAHQGAFGGATDAILVKFNNTGNRIWGTYYGGSNMEYNGSLAIDNNDNVFLCGVTASLSNISSPGAYQPVIGNPSVLGYDPFLVKFNSAGVRQWGTYYGGVAPEEDQNTCLAADDSGNVYFAGPGYSSGVFATPGAFQTAPNVNDYFLAKFNGAGQRVWSTYFGGSGEEHIYGVEIDRKGNIVFAGQTGSDTGISTPGCYQPNLQGQFDCFVEKFTPAGGCIWGTYFGGLEGEDGCRQLAIDQQNNIIFGGVTNSPSGIATPGAYDTSLVSLGDCFLVKFDSSGTLTTPVPELSGPASSLIKVFPNPTNDIVQVTLPSMSQGTITISDAMGKVIKSVTVKTEELTIDLKGLAAGVYLLEYKSEQMSETVKLIKE